VRDRRAFDFVIGNAGVMAAPFGHTADGFETQFGTNHLGHFVFVNRVAPLVRVGGRVVMVASSGHRFANVDLADPNFERTTYDPWMAYGRSKTANVLFAVEFDRRHKARGVRATALHPVAVARADDIGGRYCENCHVSEVTAAPLSDISEGARPYALDSANAKALWAKSEEMVGERF